ncbi:MAG: hypothetical protein RIQ59_385 [Bacteroidota bacterium]|jgi:hypothetical protein
MTKIKNINGTTDNTCKCGSWLKHWEKFSGKSSNYCSEKTCTQKELVGAHVQKTTSDMSWYIIPLCKAHNGATGELEVGDSTVFVSANKNETCNK